MIIDNVGRRRRSSVGGYRRATTRFFQLADLRTLKKCEKVAAVCFRVRGGTIEFLLVQTRGGRWTFPKGNAEPGLTTAQAAALEAFEEAGVHGRMEEISFATYVRPKRGLGRDAIELTITAHLCEVLWLDPPQESGRNPSWFSAEKAKRRLRESRSIAYGSELAHIVDQAVRRVRLLRNGSALRHIVLSIETDPVPGGVRPLKMLPAAREERGKKS